MSAGPSGEAVWTVTDSEVSRDSRIAELSALGMSVREISKELGVPYSTVQYRLKHSRQDGVCNVVCNLDIALHS